MKILFLHGWHGVPGGVKPSFLIKHGHDVLNPALDDDDFDAAVKTAQVEFDLHRPEIVVGSSRGGAIAMNMNCYSASLILLCPAWKNWGTAKTVKPGTLIMHNRADDVIPFSDSEELVSRSGLSPETLMEIGEDHRLADPSSLSVMLWACGVIASGNPFPWLEDEVSPTDKSSGKNRGSSQSEARYVCDACGEEIIIPLDRTEGSHQTFVEDCPVCCRANTIHVEMTDDGDAQVWAEPEQDYD